MRGMTIINPELEKAEARTAPGMAHWAGTGPAGATCGKCAFYGYAYVDKYGDARRKQSACGMFFKMMMQKQHGDSLDPQQIGCKYFERAAPAPTA